MKPRHSRRLRREAADQLLATGTARPDMVPHRLASLLAAAAADGREHELAHAEMAKAAFQAEHLVPVPTLRNEPMIKSPLAKLLATKVLATVLAVTVTGGIALAATTGALTGHGPDRAGVRGPAHASAQVHASVSARATVRHGNAGSLDPAPLCREVAARVARTQQHAVAAAGQAMSAAALDQALASPTVSRVLTDPAFSSLLATAGGSANVPDYCALLLRLPRLPLPAALAQLPGSLLAQALAALPARVLAQVLT